MITFTNPMIVKLSSSERVLEGSPLQPNREYKALGSTDKENILILDNINKLHVIPLYKVEVIDDGFSNSEKRDKRYHEIFFSCMEDFIKQNRAEIGGLFRADDSRSASKQSTKEGGAIDTGTVGNSISSTKAKNTKSLGNIVDSVKTDA